MFDENKIKKIDQQRMYEIYDNWPEIARNEYEKDVNGVDFGQINHVVFAGMGGSGSVGDIFSSILSKTDTHVEVVKGYLLPKTTNKDSLVVCTSVSGNTEETLSVLKSAFKLECKTIAFSDNGKMQKFCEDRKLNFKNVNMSHSPRASFPSFVFSILKVLEPFLPIQKNDIKNCLTDLEKQRDLIYSKNLNESNPSLNLAEWIRDIPLIYYPWGLQSAAIRFKNSLQENAKMHVMVEDVIEASHNGVVAWEKSSVVKPILIQGKDDHVKTKERWQIFKEFLNQNKIDYKEVYSIEGSILTKLINLIYLLDYSSIYKSIILGIDPTPIAPIDFVKQKLSSD